MILRNIAVRHGRQALAAPLRRAPLRALSTDPSPPAPPSNAAPTAPPPLPMTEAVETPDIYSTLGLSMPATSPSGPRTIDPVAAAFGETRRQRKATRAIGSLLARRYVPQALLTDPPGPEDVTLELLMASQTHVGHNTRIWNPANAAYIYGKRAGVHIISLEATAAHLRRAARVVEEVCFRGGLPVFVGTRKGQMDTVVNAARIARGCFVFDRWIPGTVTNSDLVLRNAKARAVDEFDNEVQGFEGLMMSRRPLLPDVLVVLNPMENKPALAECADMNIPTIAIIDTNMDPNLTTYPIPGNDDSLRCSALIAGVLARAAQNGQRRRLEAAAEGKTSWETPSDIKEFMKWQKEEKIAAANKYNVKTLLW